MTKHLETPPKALLLDLFSYSVLEGALYWRKRPSPRASLTSPAGYTDTEGYRVISINGLSYRRHRLIWAYFNSDPGPLEIDHINRIKGDDRLENLRKATRAENSYNTTYSTNKSGAPGVCWHKRDKKWRVCIKSAGENVHLGYFDDLEDARRAYIEASIEIHRQFSLFAPTP